MRGPVKLASGMLCAAVGGGFILVGLIECFEARLTHWYWGHFNDPKGKK